jgi:hypothetical protein
LDLNGTVVIKTDRKIFTSEIHGESSCNISDKLAGERDRKSSELKIFIARIMLQCNILYMIGVPLLTLEEYTTVVVQSDVLTDEEQLSVFKAITMKNNSVSKILFVFSDG